MNKILLIITAVFVSISGIAKEGMWIPTLLKAVEDDMQAMGLMMSADDIYSVNHSSLKDAVVHFGGGCTAEIISSQGLLLTNHHCGYGQIQSHSSVENDYLKDGFWAMNFEDELANPGLTATFIVKIEDVTSKMMLGIEEGMSIEEIKALLKANQEKIEALNNDRMLEAVVRPYNYGNSYFMIVTKTYLDVRLVGAPPSAVGKFGGDTDNWMWPRHTGDFSMFRVYADENNEPSEYSADNRPFEPAHHFPISLNGVNEGDFTMVFGFPGTTEQYLVSGEVKYRMEVSNPMKIDMRDASLHIINEAMRSSDELRIKYAAKQSRISNAHKKWIGQNNGLRKMNALQLKEEFEQEYERRSVEHPEWNAYSGLVEDLNALQIENEKYAQARELFIEYYYYGPELFRFARGFEEIVETYDTLVEYGKLQEKVDRLKGATAGFYKDFDVIVDRRIFNELTEKYLQYCADDLEPQSLQVVNTKFKGDASRLANVFYSKSTFRSEDEVLELLENPSKKAVLKLKKDPIYIAMKDMLKTYFEKVRPELEANNAEIEIFMKEYAKGIGEMFPSKVLWSDANSTLRLTYGKAEGSEPKDGTIYKFYTTSDGILEKHQSGHPDFELPTRLVNLLQEKDFGVYAQDGELRVCFTGSNHTTGGNSGSPALNGDGYLIGLNFDRTWESTMSDIMFDPTQCRNIMVDIRYILFIVDKYANADRLIREMTLVGGKELPEMDKSIQTSPMIRKQ